MGNYKYTVWKYEYIEKLWEGKKSGFGGVLLQKKDSVH